MLMEGKSEDRLKKVPSNIIHCGVTSPPYWEQRNYKHADQLGQEKTPEEYVERLVSIMKEVKRVLREDGTFWFNIGDGYCKKAIKSSYLKPQDLIGIPWMVALALRKDGWYIRSDIIWKKTNPQPESVTTRPSKSHEHLFLLTKSTKYFYDAEIIKENQKEISIRRAYSKNKVKDRKDYGDPNYAISGEAQNKTYEKLRKKIDNLEEGETLKCNKKDVWEFGTASEKAKHFAIFPENLVRPCIQAGSSTGGCCPKCSVPWKRIANHGYPSDWQSACNCGKKEPNRCAILDPFNGTGTTGKVAYELDRNYLGIELNPQYIECTRNALTLLDPMFSPETTKIKGLF